MSGGVTGTHVLNESGKIGDDNARDLAILQRGVFVDHGSTAGTARPSSSVPVKWFGTVAPTNAITNDEWYDRANEILKRYDGSAWQSAGSATYVPRLFPKWTGKKLGTIHGGTPGRLKIVNTFDSYAQKIWQQVGSKIQNSVGGSIAGGYFTQVSGLAAIQISGTTGTIVQNTTDFAHWISGLTYTATTAGASQTWIVGTVDTIKVVLVNNGGAVKIQVDGVDNTTPTLTSAGTIQVITIAVTRASHTVTIVQTAGTPSWVGCGAEDSTISGTCFIAIGQGGISLNQPTTQAWTNLTTFLADVQPDLFTFEAKEDSSWMAAGIDSLITAAQAGNANMDILLVQSPPQLTGDADNVAQNAIIKTKAAQYGALTWDSYTPFGTYANLVSLGWNGDGTHVAAAADAWRGDLLLRDLGLLDLAEVNPLDSVASNVTALAKVAIGADPTLPNTEDLPSGGSDRWTLVRRWWNLFDFASNPVGRIAFQGDDNWLAGMFRFGGLTNAGIKGSGDGLIVDFLNNTRADASQGDSSFFRGRARIANRNVQGVTSGAVTFALAKGEPCIQPLNGNGTSATYTGLQTDGQEATFGYRQDATGGRTYVWPAQFRFAGGVGPSDTTANTQTTVTMIYDGSIGKWLEQARAVAVPVV